MIARACAPRSSASSARCGGSWIPSSGCWSKKRCGTRHGSCGTVIPSPRKNGRPCFWSTRSIIHVADMPSGSRVGRVPRGAEVRHVLGEGRAVADGLAVVGRQPARVVPYVAGAERGDLARRAIVRRLVVRVPPVALVAVEHLAGAERVIAGGPHVVDERRCRALHRGVDRAAFFGVVVDAAAVGRGAEHDRGTCGEADRRRAVRMLEDEALLRQRVEVRCPGAGMVVEEPDPVVHVVDGDEQDVRCVGGGLAAVERDVAVVAGGRFASRLEDQGPPAAADAAATVPRAPMMNARLSTCPLPRHDPGAASGSEPPASSLVKPGAATRPRCAQRSDGVSPRRYRGPVPSPAAASPGL